MPKLNLKEKIKEKIANASAKLHTIKMPKLSSENKPTKPKPAKEQKKIKLPQIKINLKSKKKNSEKTPEPETTPVVKTLPKNIKIIDKYPLYEPFSQVFIVQDPKTGEHKYVLDELQLDTMERGIYNRILEMLLAEIESPKEEIGDPRKFFAVEAKKIVDKYRISMGWLPDVSWYKILYHAERDLVGFGKIDR
jgi:hypothetical protein